MSNGTDPKEVAVKYGINETVDVLQAANEITVLLITLLKDGLQYYKDFKTLFEKIKDDGAFREILQEAYTDIGKVPAEMGDLDAGEIVQLVGTQTGYLPRLLDAIKKQPE